MIDSVKIYALNSMTILLSFSNIENTLKIVLLLLSILYTGLKAIESYKKRNDK